MKQSKEVRSADEEEQTWKHFKAHNCRSTSCVAEVPSSPTRSDFSSFIGRCSDLKVSIFIVLLMNETIPSSPVFSKSERARSERL